MFNTLKYAKMMEEAGFSREQAETSIKILVEIMEDKLATKQDIQAIMAVMANMATRQELVELKHDLTVRMGVMLSAAVTAMAAIVTAIHKIA